MTSQYSGLDKCDLSGFTGDRKESVESILLSSSRYSNHIDDSYLYTNPELLKKIHTDLHELTYLKHLAKAQQTNTFTPSTLLSNTSNNNPNNCMYDNMDTLIPPQIFDMRKITE